MSQNNHSQRKRKPLTQLTLEEATSTRKKSRNNEGQGSSTCWRRAGTVNYMILKNFMCHSLLEVDFTQNNISLVIGKNGSGKSAILTALIVGLGGKASLTSRGTTVKTFVKVGKSSSSIEIQLCNEGPMAYRPNVYGKTITIIRNLNASGGGSYRVKSANNEVISTQAKEVLNITGYLNIQVDNPVCLLTQDTSRNFLSSSNPKNKFTLFMRATKLEMLEVEYKTIIRNKNESSSILANKKENFAKLQEEICRLRRKIEGHQSIVNLRGKKNSLQSELVWAQVKDVEEELNEEQTKVDKLVKKLEALQADSDKKNQEIEKIQESIREYDRQIAELKEELHVQKRQQAQAKLEFEEQQNRYNCLERKRQGMAAEIDSKTKDIEYLQQEIANANENMSKVEQQKKERLTNLAKLQEKLKGADDHLETMRNDLFHIKNNVNQKQNDEESLKQEIRQIDREIVKEESNLNHLQLDSGNTLMLYGRNLPRVKEMIQRQIHKFKQEPRGPLGSYMKLKDKKWAVAVEGFLGNGMLKAFTVDNQNDGKFLLQIFTKCGEQRPTIITSKFINRKHDVSKNLVQAPRDCISLYDALVIDDPIVSNCIIDQSGPENILLIPNSERAIELLSDRNRVPRNCKQGVTITGDKFYPDPHYKTYASNYHRARYLQVDANEHIQNIQENIAGMKNRKKAVQSQLQALQAEVRTQAQKQAELENKIRKLTSVKQQVSKQYDDLNNQAEAEVHSVNTLENELQDIRASINEKQALIGQAEEEARELKSKLSGQKGKLSQIIKATKALEERLFSLQEQVKEKESKQRQISKIFDNKRLEELQRRVDAARSAMVLKQSEVKNKATSASKLGNRPEELRGVPEINREIQEITNQIARIETEAEDITIVTEKFQELSEKYNSVTDTMKSLYKSLDELSKAVDWRKRHYKLTETYFVTFVKHSFKKILEFRQFRGTIEINMEQKNLELIVMPQQGTQGLTTTSNLSGGERSFSTVAFLYALWQCMDFPFYFLDEFDVYMDRLNRSKVIDILLHHANSKPELQFVFLTPQDISFITQNVSLLRLEDPERFNV